MREQEVEQLVGSVQEMQQLLHGVGDNGGSAVDSSDMSCVDLDVGLLAGFHKLVDGPEVVG